MNIESVKRLLRELCAMGNMCDSRKSGCKEIPKACMAVFLISELRRKLYCLSITTRDYYSNLKWGKEICHYERQKTAGIESLKRRISGSSKNGWKLTGGMAALLPDIVKLILPFCIIGDFPSCTYGNECVDKHQTFVHFFTPLCRAHEC